MLTNISFKAIIRQHWIPCRNKRTYICKNYINDQRAHIFQLNQRVYFLNCNQMIIHLFLCYCRPCFLKPSAMKISSRMQFVCLYAFASNACKLEVKHIIYSIWMWTKCVFSIQHNTDLQNAPPSQSNIRIWNWVDGLVASSGPRCSIQRADYRRRFIRCLFYVIFSSTSPSKVRIVQVYYLNDLPVLARKTSWLKLICVFQFWQRCYGYHSVII